MTDPVDPVQTIVDLLKTNWNTDNTDDLKPTMMRIDEGKRFDARGDDSVILCYAPAPQTIKIIGLGALREETRDRISIDIRTMKSRVHGTKLEAEVRRIINANAKSPSANYQYLEPQLSQDLCNASIMLYRWVVDIYLINFGVARRGLS